MSIAASQGRVALAACAAATAVGVMLFRRRLQAFLTEVNVGYESVHIAFEYQFWGTKMGLSKPSPQGVPYSVDELGRTKGEMEAYLASTDLLARTRRWKRFAWLASAAQRKTLAIFERTCLCYIMEDAEARALREEATRLEGVLEEARNHLNLGYTDPRTNKRVEGLSSVKLRNLIRTCDDEATRKAAFEQGLRAIGAWVVGNGFADIVRARNALARKLGYVDFYDMKVTQAEGFDKATLFGMLDTLEEGTRPLLERARAALAADKGAAALLPYNTGFALSGGVAKALDPYFPFSAAVERWGRSYAAMAIGYRGARMVLDLLDRKGKYSNGFCHWPRVAWRRADGAWQPSVAHFTSLADPSAVGSGKTALETLMHEAGHAAHFANVEQPSPLFSQERAPTSVAYAENQSMFLESLVGDAAWRARYARNAAGEVLPWELHEAELRALHPYEVFGLRAMIAVPYFEKALYELPDADVTPARIQQLADEVETRIQGGLASRPLLSVPHILSDEASCYYHGYVLAEMSVRQTRHHFLRELGAIVDNPKVGAALRDVYWKPGNSEPFLELVRRLTGAPLTGNAWVADLSQPLDELLRKERAEYDKALAANAAPGAAAKRTEDVDLQMRVTIMDGDATLADSDADGGFVQMCAKFAKAVEERA